METNNPKEFHSFPNFVDLPDNQVRQIEVELGAIQGSEKILQNIGGTDLKIQLINYIDYQLDSTQNNDMLFVLEEDLSSTLNSGVNTNSDHQIPLQRKKSKRPHASKKRLKRGQKSPLQMICKTGYFTKNMLPVGKNPHLNWITEKMGRQFIENNITLRMIQQKKGITMEDYITFYSMPELRDIWPEFFRKRVLYRELMISRAVKVSKIIFQRYLYRFEEAFQTGQFDHIA